MSNSPKTTLNMLHHICKCPSASKVGFSGGSISTTSSLAYFFKFIAMFGLDLKRNNFSF